MVTLGILGKPFGLKGEIYFYPFNPKTESLSPNLSVTLKNPKNPTLIKKIEKIRWNNDAALIKFADINSKEDAALLTHAELCIERSQLPPLEANEFYLNDLLGFDVLEVEGTQSIGQVTGFTFNHANQSIMHIKLSKNQTLDILVVPFVKKVDLSERRCYIIIPDYEE